MGSNDEDLKACLVKRIGTGYKLLGLMGKESNVLQDMIAQNIRDSLDRSTDCAEIVRVGIEDDVGRGWKRVEGRNVEENNKTRLKRLSKKGLMLRLSEDVKRRKQVRLEKLHQQMEKDEEGKEFPRQPWGKTKDRS
ncbi:hypothetical protein BDZ91DRAFT_787522 [Kalaharituber pfeilii]|nr:hypothetical protein BDZ91DRAFT_787522 [Kalaharituber pfeilii]